MITGSNPVSVDAGSNPVMVNILSIVLNNSSVKFLCLKKSVVFNARYLY